jgi:predicted MFS family arabinose efflux permease
MRTLWSALLTAPAQRQAAYAMESIALEVVYIFGPVVLVAGIGSWSLRAAIAACGISVLLGAWAFALQAPSRQWRPHAERSRGAAGALRGPGVRLLLVVFALAGLAVGAIEVAVPAGLDAVGERGAVGLVLGAWGIGSMLGGWAVSRRGEPRDARRLLAWLLVAWGATHAAVGLGAGAIGYALLLLVAGATIAPTFVCANGMLDQLAPTGTLTEAFTWTSTGLTAGIAAGSAACGAILEATSPGLALACLGAGGIVAGVLVGVVPRHVVRPVAVSP